MKRKNIVYLLIATLFIFGGCQDELEKDFVNPGIYSPTDDVPAGMFASMMTRTRTFKNDYGEFWWHAGSTGGLIGHTHLIMRHVRDAYGYFADANDVKVFYTLMTVDAYFYGHNIDFREIPIMEGLLENMSEQEKADNQIYVTLSKMVRGYRASKAVDMYNSVPYSEGLKGTEGNFFPKFDDPWEIYKTIIDDLGVYSNEIVQQANAMSADGKRVFERQDVIFGGDAQKWQQFANALRLRLAVRVSGVQEAYAKGVISEILSGNKLPTEDLLIKEDLWVSKPGDHWKRGLRERDYAGFLAPTIMYKMDKDKDHKYTPGTDDPRLPVICLPNRDTLYMPTSFDFGVGQAVYNKVKEWNQEEFEYGGAYFYYNYFDELDRYMKYNAYSVYNPATMIRNQEPWRAFTKAEVDLLLAEVALKGLGNTPKTAAEHVKDGVKSSIAYWYHMNSFSNWDKINSSNSWFLKPEAPTADHVEEFSTTIADEFNNAAGLEDKMEIIIGQKYVHLNIHDYFEVFSELRRTRHPRLPRIKFSESLALMPDVERYPYPGGEAATNADAMLEVKDQDNFTSPIFWVPDNLKNQPYYEDDYNQDYLYIQYPGIPETFPN
ncbi:SusD/RagB family nutrient-binding outer membrane lipoprotein [Puteibacter caeruleilacunae]|nr:SusD/RagB family nutrient-binding outer membrane lipoprotein [Puteibacter caeruleilacunae]